MNERRRHLAVVGVGPCGTGRLGEGIPALTQCLEVLAQDFDVTVYSLLKPARAGGHSAVRLCSLPFRTPFLKLDLFILASMIVLDACRRKIDLLHAIDAFPAGWLGVRLARLFRIPCVVSLLGEETANAPRAARRRIIARVCNEAARLTVLTRYQAAGLAAFGIGPERARVLPLGVDRSRFPFSTKPLAAPYVFLHVACANPVKDVDTLLRTFERISAKLDAKLLIVGERHVGGETADRISRLGLSSCVELVGVVPNARLHEYYSRAHFLLHTSRYESQAVVVNEAMASGVVVCATDVGLVHDLGGQFFVVAMPGDIEHLAQQVLEIAANPARYAALQARGVEWAAAHDVLWTAAEFRRVYADVMASTASRNIRRYSAPPAPRPPR